MKLLKSFPLTTLLIKVFINHDPAKAAGNCTFTETSEKVVVQAAEVHGAMGNIWIKWGDGGVTNFTRMNDGSFRDEGKNMWYLNEHRGASLQMRRSDGASMSCYTPWE